MKWKDAIEGIDYTSKINEVGEFSWTSSEVEPFAKALSIADIHWSKEFSDRVKKYWIAHWMCTDTMVGLALYKFDGEPVAVSRQDARKSEERIEFLSGDAVNTMRDFILSLVAQEEFDAPAIADLEEELDQKWFQRAERYAKGNTT